MINRKKLYLTLKGYYPNSAKFTRPLMDEFVEKMEAAGVDDTMFLVLLKKYRNDSARLVDNSFNFAPNPMQLLLYYHKAYADPEPVERRPVTQRRTFREWRTSKGFASLGDYLETLNPRKPDRPSTDVEDIDGVIVDWGEV